MRWMLLALALLACGESGGGRTDFDADIIDGPIPDRRTSTEEPPCPSPDAALGIREAIPDAGTCGIGACGPGSYCCATTNRCCNNCDPFCCPPPDAFWTPVDAPMFDAPALDSTTG